MTKNIERRIGIYNLNLYICSEDYLFKFCAWLQFLMFNVYFSAHNITKQGPSHGGGVKRNRKTVRCVYKCNKERTPADPNG